MARAKSCWASARYFARAPLVGGTEVVVVDPLGALEGVVEALGFGAGASTFGADGQ